MKKQALLRGTALIILILTFVSLGIVILYYFAALKQTFEAGMFSTPDTGQLLLSLLMTIILLILPLAYFYFTLSIFRNTLQSKNSLPLVFRSKLKWLNTPLLVLIMIFNAVFTFIVMTLAHAVFTEKPPQFFPFNDKQAVYTIEKNVFGEDLYNIHYVTTSDANKHYVCEQESGEEERCFWENNRDIQTMIAESPVELEQFVNKEVLVTGEFIYSKEQCVKRVCKKLLNHWAGLRIKSIQLK